MLTRRELGKLAVAVPVAKIFGATSAFGRAAAPNSTIAGVQIGLIAPYSFGRDATDADTSLKYHTHTQDSLTVFDEALAQSKFNAINVDIGHYVAGTSESPIPLILKHHSRFASLHLKDRKKADGPNMPWGQGDTPIREVLQLMKKRKYTWPATIELEYPVPEGSSRVAEISRCLQYCKDALSEVPGTGT